MERQHLQHQDDTGQGDLQSVSRPTPDDRVPALDGLRGIAIILVLAFHQNLLGNFAEASRMDQVFGSLANAGWCGVDLFFVLSGFLITTILYQAKGQRGYFAGFYWRRVLRIFPLYYAVLFVTFHVIPQLPTELLPAEKSQRLTDVKGDPLWFWLYLSNYSIAASGSWGHGILDVTWSLAIEEQFYLLWPAVVLLFDRVQLMRLCLLIFLLAVALRIAMTILGANPVATYILTPARMDVIAAGAFVALAAQGPGGLPALQSAARTLWKVTGTILIALFVWRGGVSNMDPVIQTIGLSCAGVHLAALLVMAMDLRPDSRLVRLLSTRPLRAFGKYSYAIYLFHMPIRAVVRDLVYGPEQFLTIDGSRLPGQLLFYAAATSLTFALAFASWHLYEKHFLRLKRCAPRRTVGSPRSMKTSPGIAGRRIVHPIVDENRVPPAGDSWPRENQSGRAGERHDQEGPAP